MRFRNTRGLEETAVGVGSSGLVSAPGEAGAYEAL